jgi:hypothetical protein
MEKKKDNNIIQPMVIRCNSPDMMTVEAGEIPNLPLSLSMSLCVCPCSLPDVSAATVVVFAIPLICKIGKSPPDYIVNFLLFSITPNWHLATPQFLTT